MSRKFRVIFLLLAIIVCLSTCVSASAQSTVTGQTAAQNARGGSVRGRTPGMMVNSGVARVEEFQGRQSVGTVITEPQPTITPRTQFIVDALDTVFSQLNRAILAFRNLLLVRAGETPTIIPTTTNTTGGITTTGGRR